MVYDDTDVMGMDVDRQVFGSAQFGPERLDFFLVADQMRLAEKIRVPPIKEADPNDAEAWQRFQARVALAKADAYEAALSEAVPAITSRISVSIGGDVDTAGPGLGIEGEFIRFLVSEDPIGRTADLIALAVGVRALHGWLAEKTKRPVVVSEGAAVIFASAAVEARTGSRDTTLAFVSRIPPAQFDYSGPRDGYVVGLRDEASLHMTMVGLYGQIVHEESWPVAGLLAE